MGHTAHKHADEIKEHFESENELTEHAQQLAEWIREANHVCFFTGAGISTSAGIPDFRGPDGVWTRRAQGKTPPRAKQSSIKAVPSPTHMAISTLLHTGLAKCVISQNTDGLHRKSGVHPDQIAELHGNTNLERCEKCGAEYMRDFRTRTAHGVHDHYTTRKCEVEGCHGRLLDSIINFGENLPELHINRGFDQSEKCDLMICMGSSLRVTPAADMPMLVAKRGMRIVIVNLQKTPLDDVAAMVCHARTDDLMRATMSELGIAIPAWRLRRILSIKRKRKLRVSGVDVNGKPMSLAKSITVLDGSQRAIAQKDREPFLFDATVASKAASIRIGFFGHYNEPVLTLPLTTPHPTPIDTLVHMAYDVYTGTWSTEDEGESALVGAMEKLGVEE